MKQRETPYYQLHLKSKLKSKRTVNRTKSMASLHKILQSHKLQMDAETGTNDSVAYQNKPNPEKVTQIHQQYDYKKSGCNHHYEGAVLQEVWRLRRQVNQLQEENKSLKEELKGAKICSSPKIDKKKVREIVQQLQIKQQQNRMIREQLQLLRTENKKLKETFQQYEEPALLNQLPREIDDKAWDRAKNCDLPFLFPMQKLIIKAKQKHLKNHNLKHQQYPSDLTPKQQRVDMQAQWNYLIQKLNE